ncbi:MAG: nucleotidyltransferase domain-containing protein, partial [Nanoarchaeota archaeon]
MEIYKLKWTRLQNEIFRLLCIKVGESLNQRAISKILKVSPTAIAKSLGELEKNKLINIKRDSMMNLSLIELNRDGKRITELKRVENLKMIYESGVVDFLEEKFPGSTIILFGSYSFGEDTIKSDIDLAVVGCKEKKINIEKFEKILEREIRINFYGNFNEINKNLRSNIFNGIILVGRI